MSHQYWNLLINMGVRHIMTIMDMDTVKLSRQFQRFVKFDVMNYFLLARYC